MAHMQMMRVVGASGERRRSGVTASHSSVVDPTSDRSLSLTHDTSMLFRTATEREIRAANSLKQWWRNSGSMAVRLRMLSEQAARRETQRHVREICIYAVFLLFFTLSAIVVVRRIAACLPAALLCAHAAGNRRIDVTVVVSGARSATVPLNGPDPGAAR